MIWNLPETVKKVLKRLNDEGFEAYIVGGCVRDCLLQKTPQDWDITTSAEPMEVKKLFAKTYDTGLQHGTVTVALEGKCYEVTTYRIESEYDDCRHPNAVIFTKNLKQDLQRRDFTINAMAYHPQEGLKDPFLGQQDLEKKIIKGVGNPKERFEEDALRMLRALRFSAQLGFSVEKETYLALQQQKKKIQYISVERIHQELEKILQAPYLEKMALLWESGLLQEIAPTLSEQLKQKGEIIIKQLQKADADRMIRWTILLQYMTAKQGELFLKHMKFDNNTIKTVTTLLQHLKDDILPDDFMLRKKANEISLEQLKRLLRLQYLIEEKQSKKQAEKQLLEIEKRKDCITLKQLAVNGSDLIKQGTAQGKQVGKILCHLLEIVHRFPEKNQKQILLCYAEQMMKKNSENQKQI
ncbi:MAG TPA: CCA tRNA nucleotidyltransferase [Candidatus Coprocola pullicola]|nr:CCA tRNA nucleotidyltransferase [Candidatus Coprocola pullicola]